MYTAEGIASGPTGLVRRGRGESVMAGRCTARSGSVCIGFCWNISIEIIPECIAAKRCRQIADLVAHEAEGGH